MFCPTIENIACSQMFTALERTIVSSQGRPQVASVRCPFLYSAASDPPLPSNDMLVELLLWAAPLTPGVRAEVASLLPCCVVDRAGVWGPAGRAV